MKGETMREELKVFVGMVLGMIVAFAIIIGLSYWSEEETVEAQETVQVEETVVEPQRKPEGYYVKGCRYYPSESLVVTPDGNEWEYQTDVVSEREPYENMPVWTVFSDNGTDDIYDDIVLGWPPESLSLFSTLSFLEE